MFKYSRNPNYLGEIMIYGSFLLLVPHIWCIVTLFSVWVLFFNLNMILKDYDSL